MNKEITIYELLGLIKDGQAPEVIRYKELIYYKEFDGYYTSNELKLKLSIMNDLNAKVEIIEELELIEEIDRLNNIINRIYNFVDRTIEIVKQQPTGDDEWILERLNGIKYLIELKEQK